jgi:hypothetical protein
MSAAGRALRPFCAATVNLLGKRPAPPPFSSLARKANTNYLIEASQQISSSIEATINQIESHLANLSGASTIISIGMQSEVNWSDVSYSLSVGFVASFNSNSGELTRGGFFNYTTSTTTDPMPGIGLGGVLSIGKGEVLSGFYGASTVQSAGALGVTISAAGNENYTGLSFAYSPTMVIPTGSISIESETSGQSSSSMVNIYQGGAEFQNYLWNAGNDPLQESSTDW